MKQGYNDRMDDSLGNRDGKKSSKEQNYKDRRDEAKAMNKAEGKRAYQSVDTMDKKSFDKTWAKFKADTKKAFGGDKYAKGGKTKKYQTRYLLSSYGFKGQRGTEIEVVDISKEEEIVYGIPKKELTKVQKEMLPFEYFIGDTSVLPPSKKVDSYAKGGAIKEFDIYSKKGETGILVEKSLRKGYKWYANSTQEEYDELDVNYKGEGDMPEVYVQGKIGHHFKSDSDFKKWLEENGYYYSDYVNIGHRRMANGGKVSKDEWYKGMEDKLGFEKFAERILKDSQFGRTTSMPKNEFKHNRNIARATIEDDFVFIDHSPKGIKENQSGEMVHTFKDLRKLTEFLQREKIYAKGGKLSYEDILKERNLNYRMEKIGFFDTELEELEANYGAIGKSTDKIILAEIKKIHKELDKLKAPRKVYSKLVATDKMANGGKMASGGDIKVGDKIKAFISDGDGGHHIERVVKEIRQVDGKKQYVVNFGGNDRYFIMEDEIKSQYAKGGGVGESDDCPEYFMEVEGDTQKAYELLKKARWFDETSTRVYNDLEDIKGFVSNDKESLSRAETYLDSKGISTSVIYNLKEKFWADLDEESTGDQNWVWNTMYFAIRDRIDPEYDIDTMSLVETANKNALNSGLIYGIKEVGKRPLYKEIAETALKNIRFWWEENIKEIYLSKIPKYIKSEMPKGTPTDEDAERIADKGAAMFYGEFEKKFKEYLNNMEGGFSKGYAKGGKIFNLDPVDGRKSFYGKAKGINLGNTTQLQSYDTIVAEYDNVNKKMTINDYYSPTTARHINSFLDYYGYPTMSKSEMLSVKGTKFEKGGAISSNYFSGMLSFLNY